ncbi:MULTISPECIES: adenine-specific DNA-methyltransferase [unclassified Xanthobacter]|uniref:adenine-specific DNA-methyltransferase n=1 Tax=unclassified Xanthobacter TaxID=2623496 RepID=UPI001F00297B|nr:MULTISPECIES: adenine-specific DNA-methyltransferase [unclassified Xanthobacter]
MRSFGSQEHAIIHGDALDALAGIASGSVDLVFADPPYNIGKDFDGLRDRRDEGEYLAWCGRWIDECRRVLKADGSFYLMAATQMMPHLDLYCRERFFILSRIVWAYDSSGVQARRFFGSMWEPILHMVVDRGAYTFNADDIKVEAKTGARRALIDYRKEPPAPYSREKVPGNVWSMPRVRFRMGEYENHPSQKPEALLERMIRASSRPGDLVLDPFAGSFTTGAVARRLGRRSISIDLNEAYVKIGLRRLEMPSDYAPEELAKAKPRKTKNRSKYERGAVVPQCALGEGDSAPDEA